MQASENIHDLLPQRPPFIFIDELLLADGTSTRTAFTIHPDTLFVEAGRWREAGLLENMAQTVAAGAGYRAKQANLPVAVGFIGAVKNFEVMALPLVNDRLITETTVKDTVFNALVVEGTISRDNALIARCEMNIFVGSQS